VLTKEEINMLNSIKESLIEDLKNVLIREEFESLFAQGLARGFVMNLSEIEILWFLNQDFSSCIWEEDNFCFVG